MAAIGFLHLKCLCIGVRKGNFIYGGEGDTVKFVGNGKGAITYVVKAEIRPQFVLVKIIPGFAQLFRIVPPVMGLKLKIATSGVSNLLHLITLTLCNPE
ncbi:MAG: hypothetical protein BWY89_01518 [Bacteroidetes bacterium ADurb.BinA012]|nr:MAG: hypothetical protein BWY89_01518 [Bacteroidetes bacterium ADurb.BinA012]